MNALADQLEMNHVILNLKSPEEFFFNQSTLQAFYFIITGGYDNGEPFSTEDWIGVFNGDICVGHYKWDGPFTTIPAMGDEGSEYTQGYLQSQDFSQHLKFMMHQKMRFMTLI